MMADRSSGTPLHPTFTGFIGSTMDALILFEACLSGRLSHVPRRPHDRERGQLIQSGNVFIYEEHSSGIKRWTDGVPWSPSRILGNFLLYRELDKPFQPGEKKRAMKRNKVDGGVNKPVANSRANSIGSFGAGGLTSASSLAGMDNASQNDADRPFIGSLVDSYQFKDEGLVKKTISVQYRGVQHHLVSYYNLDDIKGNKLRTPSESQELGSIMPRHSLISSGNFRAPVDDTEYVVNDSHVRYYYAAQGIDYAAMNGMTSRSLSVSSAQPFAHPHAWGNAPHYGASTTYALPQTLPPPTTNYTHGQQMMSYSYDQAYRTPSQSSAYNSMATRRHSVVPGTNGTSQLGYPGMSSTDRSHLGSTALLTNSGGLTAHGLPNTSYINGDLFGASAASAAAEAGHESSYGSAAAAAQSNGTYNIGGSTHHSTVGYDGQLTNGFDTSTSRLSMAEFGGVLPEPTGTHFASASSDTTPNNIALSMDHSESSSAEHDWGHVGNDSYQPSR
ncbi:Gti1/Pac2 family-domain-containing protein [Xylariaceae sp. FL1651]|nr:Gti1/Pac2 family-domain-containing protein [Xylariaceae sp. FL1651]